jgi:fluoroacetyl-CoA thioesterase
VSALEPGLRAEKEVVVTAELCTFHLGPGILSTWSMIYLMEAVCVEVTSSRLLESEVTVGTHVDVSHDAPARIGDTVTVAGHLVAREGRRLVFDVEARLGQTVLGRGRHVRAVTHATRFGA